MPEIIQERETNIDVVNQGFTRIQPEKLSPDLLRELTQFIISFSKKIEEPVSPSSSIKNLIVVFVFCLLYFRSTGQCATAPTAPSCNPPSSSVLVNNDIVSSGQVKTVNTAQSFSGLSMQGGTLIVCGSLTLTSITFSSGTIFINPGGSIRINAFSSTVFSANSHIFNFGNFTMTGSIVTGQNNTIINCSAAASFNVLFNQLVVQGPNTYFVNYGVLNTAYLIVTSLNSPGVICSNAGTIINTNIIINQYANAFLSPGGRSCINITGQIINSQSMTTSTNVNICYLAGNVGVSGAANFGAATVNNNCASCSILLPVELTYFGGTCYNTKTELTWKTASEKENAYFAIEQLNDDEITYTTVAVVGGRGSSKSPQIYSYELENYDPKKDVHYFRLKQVDFSNRLNYSQVIVVPCNLKDNPEIYSYVSAENILHINSPSPLSSIILYDLTGKIVKQYKCSGLLSQTFTLEDVPGSMYILAIQLPFKQPVYKRIIVY